MNIVQGLSYAAENYGESLHLNEHQNDGRQFHDVGDITWERFNRLDSEWQKVVPGLGTHRFIELPWYFGLVLQFSFPNAADYLKKVKALNEARTKLELIKREEGDENWSQKRLAEFIKKGEEDESWVREKLSELIVKLGKWQTTCSNDLANRVFIVSYVAMIALSATGTIGASATITGAIGLVGMLLIEIKRRKNMPIKAELCMEPLLFIAGVIADCFAPLGPYRFAFKMSSHVNTFGYLLSKYGIFQKFLPKDFKDPLPGKHVIKEDPLQKYSLSEIAELTKDRSNFQLNRSHIYSRKIAVLSEDQIEQLQTKSAEQLFGEIEEKFNTLRKEEKKENEGKRWVDLYDGFVLEEDTGWKILKEALIEGKFGGQVSAQEDGFQDLIKARLDFILNDETNLQAEAKLLADFASGCSQGWFKGLKARVYPTEEPSSAIHNQLAQFRGELAREILMRKQAVWIKTTWWGSVFNMDFVGGENNIHMTNAVEGSCWHLLRTSAGERVHKLAGRNLISIGLVYLLQRAEGVTKRVLELVIFLQYYLFKTHLDVKVFLAIFYLCYLKTFFKGGDPVDFVSYLKTFFKDAGPVNEQDYYTVNSVVNSLYEKMIPTHFIAKDSITLKDNPPLFVDVHSEIPKEVTTKLMNEIDEIISKRNDYKDDYTEKWMQHKKGGKDMEGKEVRYLNKRFVLLMLWVKGIVELTEEAQKLERNV